MNKTILIAVKNKIAKNITPDAVYVCGNSDFKVNFAFDAEWDGYTTKTARFITQHNTFVDVIFQGNVCNMPVMENTHLVHVGVYAGNLSTTTPAVIPAKKSILCGSGVPADPAPDVYAQIMEYLRQLEQNGVTDEQIEKVITDYLAENPIEGVTPEEVQAEVNRALTAAKESGEFKGEPGKDGKDGYTPQKGIDYFDGVDGKDGKDGKDGADAPPYTLPVASADTLGGVKVGEGLQINGEVLGVKPSNKAELIDTITIEEDTNYFRVDTEPDGTPYAFTDLVVRIKAPPAENIGNWLLYPFRGDNYAISITLPGFPNASQTYYGMFVCSIKNGLMTMYAWRGPYDTVFNVSQTTKVSSVNDIFRIVVIRTGFYMPAGTVIEIEGVRA